MHVMRLLATLVGALMLCGGCTRAAEAEPTLRVMSYNIRRGLGNDGKLDLERIAGIIAAERPDVVCLQEIDRKTVRSQGLDIPALLAEALAMRPIYGPNLELQGGHYGNLILTRLPVLAERNIKLPTPEGVEPRGALHVTLELAGGPIDIFCTHLGLVQDQRLAQVRHLLEQMQASPGRPTLLVGDLNEVEGQPPLQQLLETLDDAAAQDPAGRQPTFHAEDPDRRIDYILHTPHFRTCSLRVIMDERTRVASDHLPLVGELVFLAP